MLHFCQMVPHITDSKPSAIPPHLRVIPPHLRTVPPHLRTVPPHLRGVAPDSPATRPTASTKLPSSTDNKHEVPDNSTELNEHPPAPAQLGARVAVASQMSGPSTMLNTSGEAWAAGFAQKGLKNNTVPENSTCATVATVNPAIFATSSTSLALPRSVRNIDTGVHPSANPIVLNAVENLQHLVEGEVQTEDVKGKRSIPNPQFVAHNPPQPIVAMSQAQPFPIIDKDSRPVAAKFTQPDRHAIFHPRDLVADKNKSIPGPSNISHIPLSPSTEQDMAMMLEKWRVNMQDPTPEQTPLKIHSHSVKYETPRDPLVDKKERTPGQLHVSKLQSPSSTEQDILRALEKSNPNKMQDATPKQSPLTICNDVVKYKSESSGTSQIRSDGRWELTFIVNNAPIDSKTLLQDVKDSIEPKVKLTEGAMLEKWGSAPYHKYADSFDDRISDTGVEECLRETVRGTQGKDAAEELLDWDQSWLPPPCDWEDRANFDTSYIPDYIREDWQPNLPTGLVWFEPTDPKFRLGQCTVNNMVLDDPLVHSDTFPGMFANTRLHP